MANYIETLISVCLDAMYACGMHSNMSLVHLYVRNAHVLSQHTYVRMYVQAFGTPH